MLQRTMARAAFEPELIEGQECATFVHVVEIDVE
jgi:hypothetical protein